MFVFFFFFTNSDAARHFEVKDPNSHFYDRLVNNTLAGKKILIA